MRKIRLIPIKERPKAQTPIIQTLELEESIDLSNAANFVIHTHFDIDMQQFRMTTLTIKSTTTTSALYLYLKDTMAAMRFLNHAILTTSKEFDKAVKFLQNNPEHILDIPSASTSSTANRISGIPFLIIDDKGEYAPRMSYNYDVQAFIHVRIPIALSANRFQVINGLMFIKRDDLSTMTGKSSDLVRVDDLRQALARRYGVQILRADTVNAIYDAIYKVADIADAMRTAVTNGLGVGYYSVDFVPDVINAYWNEKGLCLKTALLDQHREEKLFQISSVFDATEEVIQQLVDYLHTNTLPTETETFLHDRFAQEELRRVLFFLDPARFIDAILIPYVNKKHDEYKTIHGLKIGIGTDLVIPIKHIETCAPPAYLNMRVGVSETIMVRKYVVVMNIKEHDLIMRHLIKSDIDKIRDAYNYAIHTTNPDRMKCTESFIFGYGSIEKSTVRFQSPKIYDNITDLIYDFVLAHRANWDPEYWKDE